MPDILSSGQARTDDKSRLLSKQRHFVRTAENLFGNVHARCQVLRTLKFTDRIDWYLAVFGDFLQRRLRTLTHTTHRHGKWRNGLETENHTVQQSVPTKKV